MEEFAEEMVNNKTCKTFSSANLRENDVRIREKKNNSVFNQIN